MNYNNKIIHGDCLEVMKDIPDKSVDMILCDLPYGTTACKWDTVIPFEPLWEQYKRIIKDNGAIVLFGSEPFSSALRMSNIKNYKYDWVWVKNRPIGHTQAKNKPMNKYENIMIYSDGVTVHKGQSNKRMGYYPQGLIRVDRVVKNSNSDLEKGSDSGFSKRQSHKKEYHQEFTNYPHNVLEFNLERGLHPTQKPVALFEYLIKTYTNEGEVVLDNCIGSGTTAVACINTNRKFIGIEKDEEYFKIAQERTDKALVNKHIYQ